MPRNVAAADAPPTASRRFAAVKACIGTYMAVMFYHLWQSAPMRCLKYHAENRCQPGQPGDFTLATHATSVSHFRAVYVGCAVASVAMVPIGGTWRRLLAVCALGGWGLHLCTTDGHPPMIAYVSLSLLHLVVAPANHDSARAAAAATPSSYDPADEAGPALMHLVLRCALMGGYLHSGIMKLCTPIWRAGEAMAALAGSGHYFRGCVPAAVHAAVAAASAPLTYASIAVEVIGPVAELLAALTGRPAIRMGFWVSSVGLQLGILTLMPLTDVSLGMLVFHLALFDGASAGNARWTHDQEAAVTVVKAAAGTAAGAVVATAAAARREVKDAAVDTRIRRQHPAARWRRKPLMAQVVAGLLYGSLGAYRSVEGFSCLLHGEARRFAEAAGMLDRKHGFEAPRNLLDVVLKVFVPCPATSFESGPCRAGCMRQFSSEMASAEEVASWHARARRIHGTRTLHEYLSDSMLGSLELGGRDRDLGRTVPEPGVQDRSWGVRAGEPLSCGAGRPLTLPEALGGSHFWQNAVLEAVSVPHRLALLVCSGSPWHGESLMRQLRRVLCVPEDANIEWFMDASDPHPRRHQCEDALRRDPPEGIAAPTGAERAAEAHARCETWCQEDCTKLNGDYRMECAACQGEEFGCRQDVWLAAERVIDEL